jgi:hypothetical protein
VRSAFEVCAGGKGQEQHGGHRGEESLFGIGVISGMLEGQRRFQVLWDRPLKLSR